ncbi:hypothetical protein TIFTF001_028595 [Ficus carica]|uniref:Secreted protein n=1 Tax=Ficus carica TaxID=3494 RepID=A0AA88DQ33_FICCA|nr:hypothetical protein TIFTF001_028595 [Ficus carica]
MRCLTLMWPVMVSDLAMLELAKEAKLGAGQTNTGTFRQSTSVRLTGKGQVVPSSSGLVRLTRQAVWLTGPL